MYQHDWPNRGISLSCMYVFVKGLALNVGHSQGIVLHLSFISVTALLKASERYRKAVDYHDSLLQEDIELLESPPS